MYENYQGQIDASTKKLLDFQALFKFTIFFLEI